MKLKYMRNLENLIFYAIVSGLYGKLGDDSDTSLDIWICIHK